MADIMKLITTLAMWFVALVALDYGLSQFGFSFFSAITSLHPSAPAVIGVLVIFGAGTQLLALISKLTK